MTHTKKNNVKTQSSGCKTFKALWPRLAEVNCNVKYVLDVISNRSICKSLNLCLNSRCAAMISGFSSSHSSHAAKQVQADFKHAYKVRPGVRLTFVLINTDLSARLTNRRQCVLRCLEEYTAFSHTSHCEHTLRCGSHRLFSYVYSVTLTYQGELHCSGMGVTGVLVKHGGGKSG